MKKLTKTIIVIAAIVGLSGCDIDQYSSGNQFGSVTSSLNEKIIKDEGDNILNLVSNHGLYYDRAQVLLSEIQTKQNTILIDQNKQIIAALNNLKGSQK